MSQATEISSPSAQTSDSVLLRLFRALPSAPYVLDVPSDLPYQVHPNQTAYEYSRKIGATFRTRDGEENEFHLQHTSFLPRDTSGTLFTQRPLTSVEYEPPQPQVLKMNRVHQREEHSNSGTTSVKKKISLADYKNKSVSKPAAPPTPPAAQAKASPPREMRSESAAMRLAALSPSKLLLDASATLPSFDGWPLPLPYAVQSSKSVESKPPALKPLAAQLEETGKRLKRAHEQLAESASSATDSVMRKQLEQRALATALESVLCFVRAFDHRERNGRRTVSLWPSLYGLMDLLSHRARGENDMVSFLRLVEATVAQRALMAVGSTKWDETEEEARKVAWQGMNKAVSRLKKCQGAGVKRKVKEMQDAYADVMMLADAEGIWKQGIQFLTEWCEARGVEWKKAFEEVSNE